MKLRRSLVLLLLAVITYLQGTFNMAQEALIVFDIDCAEYHLNMKSEVGQYVQKVMKARGYYDDDRVDMLKTTNAEAYKCDINKDGIKEYFVPYSCGSGGCWYLVIAEHPLRLLADIGGKLIVIDRSDDKWAKIQTLFMSGCGEGELTTWVYAKGNYVTSRKEILGDYDGCSRGQITDYKTKVGPPRCHKKA
jgi:hypothetical protein